MTAPDADAKLKRTSEVARAISRFMESSAKKPKTIRWPAKKAVPKEKRLL